MNGIKPERYMSGLDVDTIKGRVLSGVLMFTEGSASHVFYQTTTETVMAGEYANVLKQLLGIS